MIRLEVNGGIPRKVLLLMSVVGGLAVANLYYNQPLLEEIKSDLGASEVEANLVTVVTQIGYACGLLFVVPMADMYSRRRIVSVSMAVGVGMAAVISVSSGISMLWIASWVLGVCSVIPQIFVPMAGLFSRPEHKSRNMGFVLSGLLTGVLGARVVSGYLGGWLGWRAMFGIAAGMMLLCLVMSLRMLPVMEPTFRGTYGGLMKTVAQIFRYHPKIRLYSLRASFSFGSMMAVWSCLAFHLAGAPFHAGSSQVGMLGLCGMAGAAAASGVGRYVPRFGIFRMSVFGTFLQFAAWVAAFVFGSYYAGLIAAIVLVDVGAQCQQLSNQSGCLQEVPEASSRANTIFMTSLFTGGSVGTFCAGIMWNHFGWPGVCAVGFFFAAASLSVSLYEWHLRSCGKWIGR